MPAQPDQLRPGELMMDDDPRHQVTDAWEGRVGSEWKGKGLVPRNYTTHPVGSYASALPYSTVDMPLIPRSEWSDRIKEMIETKSLLSDIRAIGNNGQRIPSLDQNGQGYCLPAGSPVLMADGTRKPIESVNLGDMVLTNSLKPRRVLQTHRRLYSGDMIGLRIEGMENRVFMTADHLVPVPIRFVATPEKVKFPDCFYDVRAEQLEAGHGVYGVKDGKLAERQIQHVSKRFVQNVEVFDIGVEDEHYFIAGDGLLVHNCWMYSGTSATMMLRALANQPYVRLSGHAGACIIKSFRDEGGWGAAGLDFLVARGQPSVEFWPEKSMSRSHDKPETWANAALHKVVEGWMDLSDAAYDRNLTWDQVMTCLLSRIPVIADFNHWSHSVCLLDPVEVEPGSFGVRLLNSWSDQWSSNGEGILRGTKAVPNGATAPRVAVPSIN